MKKIIVSLVVVFVSSVGFSESSPWASVSFPAGAPLSTGAEWVVGVSQAGGSFLDAPARWQVDSEQAWGAGRLVLELDRDLLLGDLVMSFVCDCEDSDFIIQLLDDQDRIVALDLFSNVAEVMGELNVSTLVVPLLEYPTAEKVCVRRLSGPLAVHSLLMIPSAIGIDAPESFGVFQMARQLGDPLSPENVLQKSIQSARDGDEILSLEVLDEKPQLSRFETDAKITPKEIVEFINKISVDGLDFTADHFVRLAEKGELEMVSLFYLAGMPLTARDARGMTAGQGAGYTGKIRVLDWLLEKGFPIEYPDTIGRTALFAAVNNQQPDAVEYLLMRGARAEVFSPVLHTPLFYSVYWGDTHGSQRTRKALIAAGANVNYKNPAGISVLMNAARSGHFYQVRGLIENDADVRARDNDGKSVMEYARIRGNKSIIKALKKAGADEVSSSAIPEIQLQDAVKGRDVKRIQQLLEQGVDPNYKDVEGRTALGWAAYNASPIEIVELLIGFGADVNSEDSTGRTPLISISVWCSRDSVLTALLEAGADPNHQDHSGRTALHVSVSGDVAENIRVLLAYGADPKISDKNGCLPEDGAKDKGAVLHQMILKYSK